MKKSLLFEQHCGEMVLWPNYVKDTRNKRAEGQEGQQNCRYENAYSKLNLSVNGKTTNASIIPEANKLAR